MASMPLGTSQIKDTAITVHTAARWARLRSRPLSPWAGLNVRTYIMPSSSTPMATCVPCVPVSVKNVEPKMLFESVMCFT